MRAQVSNDEFYPFWFITPESKWNFEHCIDVPEELYRRWERVTDELEEVFKEIEAL